MSDKHEFLTELFEDQIALHTIHGNSATVTVLNYMAEQLKLVMDSSRRIKEIVGHYSYADYLAACRVSRNHLRRAEKLGLTEHFSALEWLRLVEQYHGCANCGSLFNARITLDHVIPLSEGGSNAIGNIQPLCESCHQEKNHIFETTGENIDYRKGEVNA